MRHPPFIAPRHVPAHKSRAAGARATTLHARALTAVPSDPRARGLIDLVGAATGTPRAMFLHPSRCRARTAAARQLAMYLMHVMLGKSLKEVGQCFGRDRTTVAHACAKIEDQRDDVAFDHYVTRLEDQITNVILSGEFAREHPDGC